MGRNPHEETSRAGGKPGYGSPDQGGGDARHLRTKTTFNTRKDTTSKGDGVKKATTVAGFIKKPLASTMKWIGKKVFQRKATEPTLTEKTAAMEDAYVKPRVYLGPEGNDGGGANTLAPQSLVTAPTADKAAGFGHQWNFQAYGANTNVAANPYDYTKAPYAKKGKMIRKYATGQEIKNFSKGKRFGPPPLKGPDPQGLQVILENSDYFKKLIG